MNLKQMLLLSIDAKYEADFDRRRFRRNNLSAFLGAIFLCAEQLIYGLFLCGPGTFARAVCYYTSAAMIPFIIISLCFIIRAPARIGLFHKFYELFIVFCVLAIALFRFIAVDSPVIFLPTVYVALLYCSAVLFELKPWQSAASFSAVSLAAILLFPVFSSENYSPHLTANLISNGIIAWAVSVINYSSFVRMFASAVEIEEKNIVLQKKNSEIEKVNMILLEQSIKDSLTGLYNRRKLDEICKLEFLKAERYQQDLSIILMDIDFFKKVNDSRGHDVGDEVLKKLAEILLKSIREVDACGRWGGEEFLIICRETDLENAGLLAERLRLLIEKQVFVGDLHITASFGVASIQGCEDVDELFKTADIRLYEAKTEGRNIVVKYYPVSV